MAHSKRGYALFLVLAFLSLICVLTTSYAYHVHVGTRNAASISAEAQALECADSGIQYALEAVRQNQSLSGGIPWTLLYVTQGVNLCYQVVSVGMIDSSHLRVKSYGEVVDGNCGDHLNDVRSIQAVRIVQANIDLTNLVLVSWEETNSP